MLSESNLDCPVLPDVNAKASSWTWQRHLVVQFCRASDLLHWSCQSRSVRLQNDPPIGREFVMFVGVVFGDDQKHSVKISIQRYPEEIWFSQASSAYSPIDVKHLGSNQLDGYWTTYQPPGTVMHDGIRWISLNFCWGLWLKWQQIHIILCSHERSTSSKRMEFAGTWMVGLDKCFFPVSLSFKIGCIRNLERLRRNTQAIPFHSCCLLTLGKGDWKIQCICLVTESSTQIYVQHCSNCKFMWHK